MGRLDYSLLDPEEAARRIAECSVRSRFPSGASVFERTLADDTPSQVRCWLRSLPVDQTDEVAILWASNGFGVRVRFGGFVDVYDDLWYPSSDDVWVVPLRGEWLLELTHEEEARFFKC